MTTPASGLIAGQGWKIKLSATTTDAAAISREILAHGIAGIARKDLQAVLASPEACDALHRDIWQSDTAALAPEWRHLLAAYSSTQFPGLLWRNGEHTSVPCDRPTTS